MSDIRLKVGVLDHPKIIKLRRRAGAPAVEGLLRLWLFAAEHKSDGVLIGMDHEDIEIACKWDGDPGAFVELLTDLRLVDEREDGALVVHDWAEHNPFAVGREARQRAATAAAKARWQRGVDAGRMRGASEPHTDSNARIVSDRIVSNRIDSQEGAEGTKPETKRPVLEWAVALADSLDAHLRAILPTYRHPTKATIQKWARDFERLHTIDKIEVEVIERVAAWSRKDRFWQDKIQSGAKFREKWNVVAAQASRGSRPAGRSGLDELAAEAGVEEVSA
jgi:hypothetical protein